MVNPVPLKSAPLAQHVSIPNDVREKCGELDAMMNQIKRVLMQPSALPEQRKAAKDKLALLAKDALQLWSLL